MKRFYLEHSFETGETYALPQKLDHYLRHVLRLQNKDDVSVFNGHSGAWSATLFLEKRTSFVRCHQQTEKPCTRPPLGLAFCSIKPDRLFFLIEKATELGVTHFFPIITDYVQGHLKLNHEKMHDHMVAAIQQCERLDIPVLHPPQPLLMFLKSMKSSALPWHLLIAMERMQNNHPLENVADIHPPCIVVGPEGGWSLKEKELFQALIQQHEKKMHLLHLGQTILRSETAAIAGLVKIAL